NEETPRDGDINAYCRTKRAAEALVESFSDRLPTTLIRPGVGPYGPGDRLSLPGIIDALEKGIYLHVGGGHTRVCLSYVGNLVAGMVQAGER
ncbi:oxidoreductase, partial [Enterococcus hirae]